VKKNGSLARLDLAQRRKELEDSSRKLRIDL
jgi:hypothetical protein